MKNKKDTMKIKEKNLSITIVCSKKTLKYKTIKYIIGVNSSIIT